MKRLNGKIAILTMAILITGLIAVSSLGAGHDARYGGVLRIAVIGEVATLDSMTTSLSPVQEFSKHVFETPFTYGEDDSPTPLLVKDYTFEENNTILRMNLREGVLFHNGEEMISEDFVASVKRWLKVSTYGKQVDNHLEKLSAPDKYSVEMHLDSPYSPILSYLATPMYACNILPKDIAEKYGAEPLSKEDYIGTGPYKFEKWVSGQYIEVVRFEDYVSPEGPPDGLAGKRVPYLDVIRLIPVPEMGTRISGLGAGEFDFLTRITPDHWARIERMDNAKPFTFKEPGYNLLFCNLEKGLLAGKPKIRKAIQAALNTEPILTSAYQSEDFFNATGNFYPEGSTYYTKAGTENYDQNNIEKAKRLLEEAGYDGTKLRYLTTAEYNPHYDQAIIIRSQLQQAGFNVELQVHDWATVGERRANPELWDVFFTRFSIEPEPLSYAFLSPDYPGWWDTEEKRAIVDELRKTIEPEKRGELWADLQALIYEQIPYNLIGKHLYPAAVTTKLEAEKPEERWGTGDWNFWNTWFKEE